MKTVLTMRKETVMKQFTKYICAFLMLVGMSVNAWGTTISGDGYTISTDAINFGNLDASTPAYLAAEIIDTYQEVTITLTKNADLYVYFVASPEDFYVTYNDANLSLNSFYVAGTTGSYTVKVRTYFALANGNHSSTLSVYIGGTQETISVTGTVINACTAHDIVYDNTGNGSSPEDDEACNGVEVSFTPSPNTGYRYNGATIYEDDMTTQITTLDANTTSFTMYNRDVYVSVHYAAKTYTINLDDEGATTAVSPTSVTATYNSNTLSSAITNPVKTGYAFMGWWSGDDGTGLEVINSAGALNSSVTVGVTTWTDGSGNWKKDGGATLHAKWSAKLYKVTVANKDNVTISTTGPAATEGQAKNKEYNGTVTLHYSSLASGYYWAGWNVYKTGETNTTVAVSGTDDGATFTMPAYDVTVSANIYGDAKFSCAEWSVTGPTEDTVFITSTASKTVRSQQAFHVTASGLPANTELTFTTFPANTRFTFKKADGTAISTDTYGKVNTDFYVYYTPTSGDTSDGLDVFSTLYVSVTGEPRKDTLDTKTVIGRHLPADFVIAAKKDGKWYALPANMTTGTPDIVEIAVDDADNPSMAYTATTNFYSIAQPNNASEKEYVRLKMQGQSNYPLFGSTGSATGIGKSSQSDADAEPILDGYLWKTIWVGNAITNAQDAIYRLYSKNKNDSLRIKTGKWGLYGYAKTTIQDIRLIPASSATVVEAYFIEYGAAGGVVEVDAVGIGATKVKAKLSGNESNKIALVETKTSSKNYATKYNYTVTFDGGINFAANDALGKILMLEWYNSSDVMVGVTSIELPKIIATSATMYSIETKKTEWAKWEVHILPDVTLTANLGSFSSGGAIRELHVYPGATLKVTTAGTARTITIDTLILRNGWTRVGTKKFDVARVYLQPYTSDSYKATTLNHTNAYLDWYIDYDQYYPMAVPWPVTVSGIKYKNSKIAASNITYYKYDGELRATNVQENQDANWAQITPGTLEPSKGYAILAKRPNGKAFGIVRMPLTFADTWTTSGEQGEVSGTHKDQVTVTAWGKGTAPWYAMGWNFIANPYMASFNGDADGITGSIIDQEGGEIKYATIPTVDFTNYDQYPINEIELKPGSPFFVQGKTAAPGETVTFSKGNIVTPAPQFRATPQPLPEQKAYIRLSNETGKDQMGLLIADNYTGNYEPDADLAKMLGSANAVKTYMRYNGDMAYVAINQTLAQEWIPVTVNIPAAGEYTYSLTNSSVVGQLEGVYLIDYATDIITNLIEQNYIFNATTAGTITNRFAINASVGERQTPTPIDAVEQDHKNTNEPIKFIYRDKMYIMFNGVIYDATGKKVR